MTRRTRLLAPLPLALAACGATRTASTTAPPPPPASSTETAAPATTTVGVYFLRDGKVAPTPAEVPQTLAVATAAINALLAGPPDGYATAVPGGTRLVSLSIENGVATATLSPEARDLTVAAEAQIVYTLTRFPTVGGVALRLPDAPLPIRDDNGEPLDTFASRANFEQETPPILVDSPLAGATVTSPMRVTGTSNLFEASSVVELVRDGTTLVQRIVTATAGNGERGSFAVELPYTGTGPATLVSYDRSAADGSIENRVEIPVTLG
jgi:hypothetical protein